MAVVLAVLIGAIILGLGVLAVQMLATGPPPDPDRDAVVAVALDYVCTVCGMRLTVTHAQDDEPVAPKHCRQEMEEVGSL